MRTMRNIMSYSAKRQAESVKWILPMPFRNESSAGDGRNWPFTLRVTPQERKLLRQAANEQRTSVAEIVRRAGLDSLLSQLSRGHS